MQSVNVNLLGNNMVAQYDESILDNDTIIKAVVDAGYGAVLSRAPKQAKKADIASEDENTKAMKQRLIWSIVFWVPLMYVAMYHMFYEWFGLPIPQVVNRMFHGIENALSFGFVQFLLVLPIMYLNRNYFIVGFKRLFKKSPNMDSLIAIGSTAAIVYGIYAIFQIGYGLGHGKIELVQKFSMDLYFESAGTILTLITVGKYLETKSKGKTSDAIRKLMDLAPKTAVVLREGKEVQIGVEEIVIGDILVIKPGSGIPVDGTIVEGNTWVDQSSITGESIPVEKSVGDPVVSGTMNKNGFCQMKVTKVGQDTTLAQIIQLVEEAGNSKAPIARIADQVSGVFVPVVITIAVLACVFWILQGQSFEFALSIGIAVLVISCPCALGLATPVAIMVGTGKAAENGILIKSAESLETLHLVDTVVLDKTGTITEGKPKVVGMVSNIEERRLLQMAASLEQNSEHPLADAVLEKAKAENIELLKMEEFLNIPGRGIRGKLEGEYYFAGNSTFMEENKIDVNPIRGKIHEARTLIFVAKTKKILGAIEISDEVKSDSLEAIQALQKKQIEVVMLTGDNQFVAHEIGKELGIDKVISEVLPQDKEKEVEKLQQNGKKVTFVGDGINDSPALVRADVGLAIGAGTDIAIESADCVLMKSSLLDVVRAIELSKAVIRNIKMNLFWAFFYNVIGIPIAAGVFYLSFGWKLNPMIGAAAMSLSSVCVVMNALRLRNFKGKAHCNLGCEIKREEKFMTKTILIEGMQCNHCKMSVEKALGGIEGVTKVEVSLENKNAIIESTKEIEDSKIKEVVEEAGFELK